VVYFFYEEPIRNIFILDNQTKPGGGHKPDSLKYFLLLLTFVIWLGMPKVRNIQVKKQRSSTILHGMKIDVQFPIQRDNSYVVKGRYF
jgi:hypothetical protein